nr:uncharacterized protein LOC123276727 isoform X2 [Equus asinus]
MQLKPSQMIWDLPADWRPRSIENVHSQPRRSEIQNESQGVQIKVAQDGLRRRERGDLSGPPPQLSLPDFGDSGPSTALTISLRSLPGPCCIEMAVRPPWAVRGWLHACEFDVKPVGPQKEGMEAVAGDGRGSMSDRTFRSIQSAPRVSKHSSGALCGQAGISSPLPSSQPKLVTAGASEECLETSKTGTHTGKREEIQKEAAFNSASM